MLVLSRRRGQSIMIGASVEVSVIRTSAGRVRLGIAAPPHLTIRRAELLGKTPQGPQTGSHGEEGTAPAVDRGT
jgi:carbon storage regulator